MARTVTPITDEGRAHLTQVTKAREAFTRAEDAYRDALVAGYEAGLTFTAMGEAAGVLPQTARKIVLRAKGEL